MEVGDVRLTLPQRHDPPALNPDRIRLTDIRRAVCKRFKLTDAEMTSPSRVRRIARPRQLAIALSYELTRHSLPSIGKHYGRRDHTTCLHACKRIAALRQISRTWEEHYQVLKIALTYKPANDSGDAA